ncbi:MAG TPA: hypothetical protein VME24_10250 [Alphaproteobacteria bacterium]|nr:hypothetical protein [Alphaproteobacteria bacterium]
MNISAKTGRKSKVTTALVMRVVERVENGLSLKIAIAGEGVTLDAYLHYLHEHPKLEALQETARRKFMERAVGAMLDEEKPAASYRWLLEHCHPDLLAQPGDIDTQTAADEPAAASQTIAGMPNELLDRLREYAKNAQ